MSMSRALIALMLAMPCTAAVATTTTLADGTQISDSKESDAVVDSWASGAKAPRGDALMAKALLDQHNRARAAVGVAPLEWDAELAAGAAAHAARLARTRQFAHSVRRAGEPIEGENLWMGTRTAYRYEDMAGSWVAERAAFRAGRFPAISRTGSWSDVGHYSQMIWAETRAVGCAVASDASDDYLVCRYFPAGNVWGESPLDAPVRTAAVSFENASAR